MTSRRRSVKGGTEPVSGREAAKTGNSRKAPATYRRRTLELHGVGLFLGQVADNRELVHQPLIGLDQQDDPEDERSQPDEHVERERDKDQPRTKREDGQAHPYGN